MQPNGSKNLTQPEGIQEKENKMPQAKPWQKQAIDRTWSADGQNVRANPGPWHKKVKDNSNNKYINQNKQNNKKSRPSADHRSVLEDDKTQPPAGSKSESKPWGDPTNYYWVLSDELEWTQATK